jgi:hypothetical protein
MFGYVLDDELRATLAISTTCEAMTEVLRQFGSGFKVKRVGESHLSDGSAVLLHVEPRGGTKGATFVFRSVNGRNWLWTIMLDKTI